jgi:hypothetical protein
VPQGFRKRDRQQVALSERFGYSAPPEHLLLAVSLCARRKALGDAVAETQEELVEVDRKFFRHRLVVGITVSLHPKPQRGREILRLLLRDSIRLQVFSAMVKELTVCHGRRSIQLRIG